MTEHWIDLLPHQKRYDGARMFYAGRYVGFTTSGALYAAARWLLEQNLALPEDTVATYWDETRCMTERVGEAAKWTVQQNDYGNPSLRLIHWRPFPAARMRPKSPSRLES